MRICLDMRAFTRSGAEAYGVSLVRQLLKIDAVNQYIVICSPQIRGFTEGLAEEICYQHRSSWEMYISSTLWLPDLLRKIQADLYHSLKHIYVFRCHIPRIVTLHSAAAYFLPQCYSRTDLIYWRLMYQYAARSFNAVLVVSHAEKKLYERYLPSLGRKAHVIHLAPSARLDSDELPPGLTELPSRFLLYVGNINPFKNFDGLLVALAELHVRYGDTPPLLCIGDIRVDRAALDARINDLGLRSQVKFLGFQTRGLGGIFRRARAVVLPSLYESFSQVAAEALASGCPVIGANVGSLPEVVGDAGLLVNDRLPATLAEAMHRILRDDEFQAQCSKWALERSHMFSWERTAERTLAVYHSLVNC
jgi:glycosyltransferase involved in cell wall biosynthesis